MTLELKNIRGLLGTHVFQFARGVSRIEGKNASGKTSVATALKLLAAPPSGELRHSLHELSETGSSTLRIGHHHYSIVLIRDSAGHVLAANQTPVDSERKIATVAVIDRYNPLLTLDSHPIFEVIGALSRIYPKLLGELSTLKRQLREAKATALAYEEMAKRYHGHKTQARSTSRRITKLKRILKRSRSRGTYHASTFSTVALQDTFVTLDSAWDEFIKAAIAADVEEAQANLRKAKDAYYDWRLEHRGFLDAESKLPKDERQMLMTTRREYTAAQQKFRSAKAEVEKARRKLDSPYKVLEAHLTSLESALEQASDEEALNVLQDYLHIIGEMNERYDIAVAENRKASSRIDEERSEIRQLETKARRKISLVRETFNAKATEVVRGAFEEQFQGTVQIDGKFEVTVNRDGGTLSASQLPSPERIVIAVVLATFALRAYRPSFQFVVLDDLPIDAVLRHRLAHMLRALVKHVIYTVAKAEVASVRVVPCRHRPSRLSP
jgi:hypothetical protein